MKRSAKITMLVLFVVFVILFAMHRTRTTTPVETVVSEAPSKEDLEKLNNYKERFARNAYHLDRALSSVQELESALDTIDGNVYGDVAIRLKILHHRTNIHLQEIIKSLKKYEEYPNLSHQALLEDAISKLKQIDKEIISDSLNHKDIQGAFLFTLNALAKAEISISESAYKTNQDELARLALKQAQLHVKNAFLMDYSIQPNSKEYHNVNTEIFRELDGLIEADTMSVENLDTRLTKISKELDSLLQMIKVGNP